MPTYPIKKVMANANNFKIGSNREEELKKGVRALYNHFRYKDGKYVEGDYIQEMILKQIEEIMKDWTGEELAKRSK